MRQLIAVIILAAGLALAASCGNRADRVESAAETPSAPLPQPADGGASLPGLAELGREASLVLTIPGSVPLKMHGVVKGPGGFTLASKAPTVADPLGIAYAIYVFNGVDDAAQALRIRLDTDYRAPVYCAVADWSKGVWDYSAGLTFGTAVFNLNTLSPPKQDLVNADGQLMIALVLASGPAETAIEGVEIMSLPPVSGFSASNDRYDGILLSWENLEDAQYYRIERRVAAGEWMDAAPGFIGGFAGEYLDHNASPEYNYEYRLSAAMSLLIGSEQEVFWNDPVTSSGLRYGAVISDELGVPAEVWPATFANFMSYFVRPSDAPDSLEAVRATSYPPKSSWDVLPSGEEGFTDPELTAAAGLPTPFAISQPSSVNSLSLSYFYSGAAGTSCQVLDTAWDGSVNFHAAQQIRPAGSHVLGTVQFPRRIGAICWNSSFNRLEMAQSQDELGHIWENFDSLPNELKLLDTRKPDGPLHTQSTTSVPYVTYRDAATGLIVIRSFQGQWVDESPIGQLGFEPKLHQVMSGHLIPGQALVYMDKDHKSLTYLLQDFHGTWLYDEIKTIHAAPEGETIDSFDLYTGVIPSNENYVVYTTQGKLYFMFSSHQSLESWSPPQLLDGSGDCHNAQMHVVGSDAQFGVRLLVNYIGQNEAGETVINFRDIREARMQSLGF